MSGSDLLIAQKIVSACSVRSIVDALDDAHDTYGDSFMHAPYDVLCQLLGEAFTTEPHRSPVQCRTERGSATPPPYPHYRLLQVIPSGDKEFFEKLHRVMAAVGVPVIAFATDRRDTVSDNVLGITIDTVATVARAIQALVQCRRPAGDGLLRWHDVGSTAADDGVSGACLDDMIRDSFRYHGTDAVFRVALKNPLVLLINCGEYTFVQLTGWRSVWVNYYPSTSSYERSATELKLHGVSVHVRYPTWDPLLRHWPAPQDPDMISVHSWCEQLAALPCLAETLSQTDEQHVIGTLRFHATSGRLLGFNPCTSPS